MDCLYCQGEIISPEKPYVSKQALMEGSYHWGCFVEACKNRMPVAVGAVSVPGLNSTDEEPSTRSVAAVED